MANQFIIQNGAQVTGSLFVSESVIAKNITADSIQGALQFTDISASNTIRAKSIRLDEFNNAIYFLGNNNEPSITYNQSQNGRLNIIGQSAFNLPELNPRSAVYIENFTELRMAEPDARVVAKSFSGSIEYDFIENVPGFVDTTGDISSDNIAVFAESAQGLPQNLPFSLPLYNDGNPTIKAYSGLSYDGTTFTINGGTIKAKYNELNTSSVDTTAANSGSSVGEIVKMGNTETIPGALYFFSSSATWFSASATHESHSTGLLGVAVGTNSSTDGMLLNGFIHPTGSSEMGTLTGSVLYMSPTYGEFTGSAPGLAGEVARIVGYRVEPNMIYFKPDSSYIVLA